MEDFTFYSPTKIIFGKNAEQNSGSEVKAFGGSRVLVHHSGGSAVKSGIIDRIKSSLTKDGIYFIELSGVVPNPRLGKVHEGIRLCRENNIDFILAVGGGSVIDSAKAISLGACDAGEVWDFYSGARKPERNLPIGAVLTISASGSESSTSSVITNEDGWLKRSYNSDMNRPKFALLNPELTFSLPWYQTACGVVDIMMHTMDRYFSPTKDTDFIDRISEALLQSVIRAGEILLKEPDNYAARADLMWAGSISHNTLTGTGKITDFAPHHIEHELSGKYDVAHGAGLSAIWGHWARYVYKTHVMKFAQFAVRVWNISMDFDAPERTALAGIERTEDYFHKLGMPVGLKELGITADNKDIREMSEKATFFGKRTLGGLMKLGFGEISDILEAANR